MKPPTRRELLSKVRYLAGVWDLPGLERLVCVEFSPRLRTSLGRAYAGRGLVRLNRLLLEPAHRHLLDEVLTHELAHIAAPALHGADHRPHGPGWAALVRAAGYEPRSRLGLGGERPTAPPRQPQSGPVFVHRCPICGMARSARRPQPRWRCAACVAAGLDGRLMVSTLPREAGG